METSDALPVRRLTVLYDADCELCVFVRDWLDRQPQLVRLEPIPAGSPRARERFPELDHRATLDEVTVVGDSGQVYRGAAAWIVTLWALRRHRALAHRLSTPAGARAGPGRGARRRQVARGPGARGPVGRVGVPGRRGLDVSPRPWVDPHPYRLCRRLLRHWLGSLPCLRTSRTPASRSRPAR